MFAVEHVVKSFSLLEKLEKEKPCFNQTQKQQLYRIAFHKESFDEVEKIILQASAPNLGMEERKRLLEHHLEAIPKVSSNAEQIEDYIFQVQHMTYEKNKANEMLEDILKQRNIAYDLDAMLAKAREKPLRNPAAQLNSEKHM